MADRAPGALAVVPAHLDTTATAASRFFERRLSLMTRAFGSPKTPRSKTREAIRIPKSLPSFCSSCHPSRMSRGAYWCRKDSSRRSARRPPACGADRPATPGSSTRLSCRPAYPAAREAPRSSAGRTFPTAFATGGRGGDRWRPRLPPNRRSTAWPGGHSARARAPRRARLRAWLAGIRGLDPEGLLQLDRTSCRKGGPQLRFPTAAAQASCYGFSWRNLRRLAPESLVASSWRLRRLQFPTTPATAPTALRRGVPLGTSRSRCERVISGLSIQLSGRQETQMPAYHS
jgi:hypothetical protein